MHAGHVQCSGVYAREKPSRISFRRVSILRDPISDTLRWSVACLWGLHRHLLLLEPYAVRPGQVWQLCDSGELAVGTNLLVCCGTLERQGDPGSTM